MGKDDKDIVLYEKAVRFIKAKINDIVVQVINFKDWISVFEALLIVQATGINIP